MFQWAGMREGGEPLGLKLCGNEIFWPKYALAKYFWNVLKNRSNAIRTNEIRISQEPPVAKIF